MQASMRGYAEPEHADLSGRPPSGAISKQKRLVVLAFLVLAVTSLTGPAATLSGNWSKQTRNSSSPIHYNTTGEGGSEEIDRDDVRLTSMSSLLMKIQWLEERVATLEAKDSEKAAAPSGNRTKRRRPIRPRGTGRNRTSKQTHNHTLPSHIDNTTAARAAAIRYSRHDRAVNATHPELPPWDPPPLRGDGPTTYVALPPPNASAPPLSFGACCGLGHRLSKNVPTMVHAVAAGRPLRANWPDVKWSVLFNDTANVEQGPQAEEDYSNNFPGDWPASPLAGHGTVPPQEQGTPYSRYGYIFWYLFEMPLGHSVVRALADALGPLVRSFLDPLRGQYAGTHLCAHVREGNNETGDWEGKTWRHIDLESILDATLEAMRRFAADRGADDADVSVFAASDSGRTRPYLEARAPPGWRVVRPGREMFRPGRGVWFGEHGSKTGSVLSEEGRNQAMVEAVADVFALGECDALFIPNYSSFSMVGIMLTRAEGRRVFFLQSGDEGSGAYIEYP